MFSHNDIFSAPDLANPSSFKLYDDGIGYNGYSLRLRNVSMKNLTKNIASFVGWSLGVGFTMGKMIGVVSTDKDPGSHYAIISNYEGGAHRPRLELDKLAIAISESNCNIVYDCFKQYEYYCHSYDCFYSLVNQTMSRPLELKLCRVNFEPILEASEECLIELMKSAYSVWEKSAYEADQAAAKEDVRSLFGVGIFTTGILLFGMYRNYRDRNDQEDRETPRPR